jgi:uncharacterized protein (DUF1800 family)
MGARPGEIERASSDPRGFLVAQIRAAGADPTGPDPATSGDRTRDLLDF